MAFQPLNTLKTWFKQGLKPTQQQFWDWMDSFWHKDENIPSGKIEGLQTLLDAKVDRNEAVFPDQVSAYQPGTAYYLHPQTEQFVSFSNAASEEEQFQTEALYRLREDAPAGENPESHPGHWSYQGTTLGSLAMEDILGLREALEESCAYTDSKDATTVHQTGDEHIDGEKTFIGKIILGEQHHTLVANIYSQQADNISLDPLPDGMQRSIIEDIQQRGGKETGTEFLAAYSLEAGLPATSYNVLTLESADGSSSEQIRIRSIEISPGNESSCNITSEYPFSGDYTGGTASFSVREKAAIRGLEMAQHADEPITKSQFDELNLRQSKSETAINALEEASGNILPSTWEQDVAGIRAITTHEAGMDTGNYATGAVFEYNPASTASDDGNHYLKPDDINVGSPGRWVKQKEFCTTNHLHNFSQIMPDDDQAKKLLTVNNAGEKITYTPYNYDQIISTSKVDITDPTWQDQEIRLLQVKKDSNEPCFEGAAQMLDIFAPPGTEPLLKDQDDWVSEGKTLVGENYLGQLGKVGQLRILDDGTICRCISSFQGNEGEENGSATYRRNRAVDVLDPANNAQDLAVCDLLNPSRTGGTTDDGWNLENNTKVLTIPARLGTWWHTIEGYNYFCFEVSGSNSYWWRTGNPEAIYRYISNTSHTNLCNNLLAHDYSTEAYTQQVEDELSYHDQVFYDNNSRTLFTKVDDTRWEQSFCGNAPVVENTEITAPITWGDLSYSVDLSKPAIYKLTIAQDTSSLAFDLNFPEDAGDVSRNVKVIINNANNTTPISTITFAGNWNWDVGVEPTGGMAAGTIATLELYNESDTEVKPNWSIKA